MSWPRGRLVAAGLAALVVASACSASAIKRGVRVNRVNTNVGLGVESPLNAAPPNIAIPVGRVVPHENLPFLFPTLAPIETFLPTAKRECPRAGPFDFPALEAGVEPDPSVRPATGNVSYKLDGTVVTDAGPAVVDTFETRRISNVVADGSSPNAFDYTMAQTALFDERSARPFTIETTYRVAPTGNFRNVPNPPVVNVSDNGRGVFILKTVFRGFDDQGHPIMSTFQPSSPVQILAYPINNGAAVSGTGTDPASGSTLQITGKVAGKKQVDACGKKVDSWLVQAEEIYRYTDSRTLQTNEIDAIYNYAIAPQYGSLIVFEHVEAPKEGPVVKIDARIGSVPRRTGAG